MELIEKHMAKEPIQQFVSWRQEAHELGERHPDAMALATADKDGRPSARFVMLRAADDLGFVFYTNYDSRKASELGENPWGSLLFYWPKSGRQVRVEGQIEQITYHESDAYFSTRLRETQIEAWASPQSEVIADREWLERLWKDMESKFPEAIPRPDWWGGYRLHPTLVEFWEQRPRRMHDRLRYSRRDNGTWSLERLAP